MDIIKRKEVSELIKYILRNFNDVEKKEILNQVLVDQDLGLSISIFRADISGLEVIIKYLKENKNKSFKEISKVLNRKLSTVYNTYTNSKSKFAGALDISDNSIIIPLSIFANRKFSILETLVAYLKDECKLQFKEIAKILNKKYSTVATVYSRFTSKKNSNLQDNRGSVKYD